MTESVLPGLYRIPVPLPGNPLKELNAYLLRGNERSILIDTGFRQEECRSALFAGLEELGCQGQPVDVLLTHLHSDHSGLAVEAAGERFTVILVDAGNPHGVIFCSDPDEIALEQLGPLLENHPALGERRNIELVSCPSRERLKIRVWERGSGITLACGTGACAVFGAALAEKRCGERVEAELPGGILALERRGEHIFMTGPARTVFEGEME